MNIAFIFSAALTPINGENIRGRMVLQQLLDAGHTVDLLAPESDFPDHPNLRFFKALGGKRYSTKSMVARHLKFALSSPFFLPQLRRPYDVVYCFGLAGAFVAYPLAVLTGRPLVCDFYEQDFPEYHYNASGLLKFILFFAGIFAKSVLKRANGLIVLTESIRKDQLSRLTCPIHTVYDAADETLLAHYQTPKRNENDTLTFLFHGGIEKRDGLNYFFQACARLVDQYDFRVLIVGVGRVKDELESYVQAQPNLAERTTFTGWVNYEDIASYIQQGDVGILPMVNQPINSLVIPRKLFEYIGWEMPVIVSDFPSIREVLGGNEAFFIQSENVDSITKAMTRCLSDRTILEQKRDALRKREKVLNLQQSARQIVGILETCHKG